MCWWATKKTCRRGWAFRGRRSRPNRSWTPSVFFGMIDNVVKKHPHVKVVATTLREVHSTKRHSWSAVAWIDGKTYAAPTAELDVVDRVGGGDGFAAGFIYGLLSGERPKKPSSWAGRTARC
jgi:2-dehydro-3-deoxygluconokinase